MATEPQEQTDLGKDVERAIEEFWLNCQKHGPPEKLSFADCGPCQVAKKILESAIRARIDQPRPEPAPEPHETLESIIQRAWPKDAPIVKLREIAQILMDSSLDPRSREVQLGRWFEYHLNRLDAPPHECWCKDTRMGHEDCKKRGFHRCGCGATNGLVSDRWIGGLAKEVVLPNSRPMRVNATGRHTYELIDEPKPQHIFERDRTSKHSMPRPIVTGSRAHQLAATVYDLLGFNEPGMVAQWITEAKRIALGTFTG